MILSYFFYKVEENDREETMQISENHAKEKSHSNISCIGQ